MLRNFFLLLMLLVPFISGAQELKARVTVLSNRVANNVDKKSFQTLQTALEDFVNNRKWTSDAFGSQEKIECNMLLNLKSTGDPNIYSGSLTIQSARPVFNSSYLSPIINFQDNDILFKYVPFQQLNFNENNVSGNDPEASNLTAIFAYYVDIILGMDYDSFSPKGGNPYFQKAQSIVDNAPEAKDISGWKPFDGTRNRYWLTENFLNSKYTAIHDVIYDYYRMGLDKLYDEESNARIQILNALNLLNTMNTDNPNTMVLQFFFQGKAQELINIFSKASPSEKSRASELLQALDVSNASKYKDALKS
ncbi:MAG TPA: DUF4835 family protein [Chitinophagaceae bacterium]|nr:DUF4835 family protein [Chitinophagaceae bacterium]